MINIENKLLIETQSEWLLIDGLKFWCMFPGEMESQEIKFTVIDGKPQISPIKENSGEYEKELLGKNKYIVNLVE